MSSTQSPVWIPKLAWSEVLREAPPKRPAEERARDFEEIYSVYDEATARAQASRCIQCPEPLCRVGCPLSNRIPEWLALAADGNFLEAARISRTTSNMPEVCARVCPQERLCEGWCLLNARSEAVAIGAVERFINEYAFACGVVKPVEVETNGCPVAVIGSGPGGLACADELSKLGYEVTVFESASTPGGLLVNGIPSFKLEKRIVERRIELLRAQGVKFRLGTPIGDDLTLGELRARFGAVFIGFGAQKPKALDIPGAGLKGVYQALPFLIEKNVGDPAEQAIAVEGKAVAVLGGGDTAMDCLRTAVRCGAAQAVCLYRRDLENMPGSRREYANALEEGAEFRFLVNPISLEGDAAGQVTHVRTVQMKLGEPDAQGRRRPRVIPDTESLIAADLVLVAYGFDPVSFHRDNDFSQVRVNDWGGIVVDQEQMTSIPGVFAGGDSARGPSLVVHAVRDGRAAATGIDRYLRRLFGGSQGWQARFRS
jgi:glutamate synthase (NADPH/NADH) small chain